jgi:hypothetical protein
MASLLTRIGKLEQSRASTRRLVVVMADGHSREEIGDFLLSQGVRRDRYHPLIIINGSDNAAAAMQRRPLRIV